MTEIERVPAQLPEMLRKRKSRGSGPGLIQTPLAPTYLSRSKQSWMSCSSLNREPALSVPSVDVNSKPQPVSTKMRRWRLNSSRHFCRVCWWR